MLQDIVLGIIQGLTEFLPVSSSGHLVVAPAVFGWEKPSVTFDLFVHVATLLAVLVAMRREVGAIVTGVLGGGPDPRRARWFAAYLAVGTVPAALAGWLFGSTFESLFERPLWACGFWLVSGAILLGAERIRETRTLADERPVTPRTALGVGLAQAVAITPGISRSGATIAAGMALGLPRDEAARFSFLLSIPIIVGAALSRAPEIASGDFELTASVWAGFVAAAVSGYLAVTGLLRLVQTRSLRPFAIYLFVVSPLAALTIVLQG